MMKLFENYHSEIEKAMDEMYVSDKDGNKIDINDGFNMWTKKVKEVRDEQNGLMFFSGNGASATMAEHMSSDWFQNADINTSTCSETAYMTAVSNDISYEDIFSYKINKTVTDKDILVLISSSGNSPNIVKAAEAGIKKGAYIITISGMKEDNRIRKMGDLNFYIALDKYGMVESAHAVILHFALDNFLQTYMGGIH